MEDREIRKTFATSNDKPSYGLPKPRSETVGGPRGSVRALVDLYEKKAKDSILTHENEYTRNSSIGRLSEDKLKPFSSEVSPDPINRPQRATVGFRNTENYLDYFDQEENNENPKNDKITVLQEKKSFSPDKKELKEDVYRNNPTKDKKLAEKIIIKSDDINTDKKLAEKIIIKSDDSIINKKLAEKIIIKSDDNIIDKKSAEKIIVQSNNITRDKKIAEKNIIKSDGFTTDKKLAEKIKSDDIRTDKKSAEKITINSDDIITDKNPTEQIIRKSDENKLNQEKLIKNNQKPKEIIIENKINDSASKNAYYSNFSNNIKPRAKLAEKISLTKSSLNTELAVIEENEKSLDTDNISVKTNELIVTNNEEKDKKISKLDSPVNHSNHIGYKEEKVSELIKKELPVNNNFKITEPNQIFSNKLQEKSINLDAEIKKDTLILETSQNYSRNAPLKENEINESQNYETFYGETSQENSLYTRKKIVPESVSHKNKAEITNLDSQSVEELKYKENKTAPIGIPIKPCEEAKLNLIALENTKNNVERCDSPNIKLKMLQKKVNPQEKNIIPQLKSEPTSSLNLDIPVKIETPSELKQKPSPLILNPEKSPIAEKQGSFIKPPLSPTLEQTLQRTSFPRNRLSSKPLKQNNSIFKLDDDIINEIDILCSNCYEYISIDDVDLHSKKCIKPLLDTSEISEVDIRIKKMLKAITQRKFKSNGIKYNLYCKLEENSIAIIEKLMVRYYIELLYDSR